MKKTYLFLTLIFVIFASGTLLAQNTHTIDFEPAGVGADWDWTVDENDDNPPLEFVANPDASGINTSDTVAKFTARLTGQPWALCFTHDDGEYTFDAANSTVTIIVNKPVVSDIGFKVEGISGNHQIIIPNTLTDQWEEITFDFSGQIGNTYSTMVIIPDFDMDGRDQENIIYFDNLQIPDGEVVPPPAEPEVGAVDPTHEAENVMSIYSDVYTDLEGTNFNPGWGQSTIVTLDYLVDGNNTIKYENLNFQGTNLGSVNGGVPQDVSSYEYFHMDLWVSTSTNLNFYILDQSAGEVSYPLPITAESWVSVDIPLSHFTGEDMTDIHQFKVDGNGTVWFDNWFFWSNPAGGDNDTSLSDLQVDDTTVDGFAPTILSYDVELPYGTSIVPTVTATTNDPDASYVVNDAAGIPGTTEVVVTAEDEITVQTYNVNFTLAPATPDEAAPTPEVPEADVISLYSNAYTDVVVDTWSAGWDNADVEDIQIAGNDTKLYTNLTFAGIEFTSQTIDATAMSHFHMDVWTPDNTSAPSVFKVKLVDFGPDGVWGTDDTEHEITFDENTMDSETWVGIDVPLTDFVNLTTTGHLAQMIISGDPNTVYVDNIYFYSTSTEDVLFFDDFESGGDNWTFEGTWGVTDEESYSPTNSMHESPGGNYGANIDISTTLATPWDLSGVLDATLTYWYMSDIETAFDYMYVEISSDGESWLNLATYDEEGGAWTEETIALGGFVGAGYEAVQLRFRFESDGGYEVNGMYIDDIEVITSMEDTAAPFIVHAGPDFYEGTAEDYVFTADIVDVSGIAAANVIYTLDGGEDIVAPYTSADGNVYTFTIPAQDAGVQIDYAVEATDASVNSNSGIMAGYVYIAGSPFIYDNGVVDFYTTIAEGTGAAVRIENPAGFQLNLAYALIRNYTDVSGQDNDDFEFHVWADNGGVPGDDLITPFIVTPEASYTNTRPMTRVDLRPYAADLANIQGDFYVGFLANTGGQYGLVHCTITQPGEYANSFLFDGTGWTFWDGTDLHFRAVAELIPTAIGTVEGVVTRSDNGNPLEGVMVTIGGASSITDATGAYTVVTDPGTQDVGGVLAGFNDYSGSVDVLENDTVTYDFAMSPAFWAPVNLTATYNAPNPNVVLQWDEPESPTGEPVELIYDDGIKTSIDVEDHYVETSTRILTGYNVYRDGEVIGSPTSTFYLDPGVPGGDHVYYVTALYSDPDGESGASNEVEVAVVSSDDDIIPIVTELTGNYPNPFNPVTNISFAVSEAGQVNIEIYNIKGEKVRTLLNEHLEADFYTEEWNGSDDNRNPVSSGVYFYKMKTGRYTSTKKMILMK